MRVFISCDMEGVAGIVDWEQVRPGPEYELGRRLLLNEVNAAIDGAVRAGATEVLVNDSHGAMQNLPPDQLHAEAGYCSGRHKPLYMMEGLEPGFEAALFVGYHGAVGGPSSTLSHTYNPSAVTAVTWEGHLLGESGINALVASHFGVPVALVSGDQHTAEQARPVLPGVETVVVKRSVSRLAASSLHPAVACRLIEEGTVRALARLGELGAPRMGPPYQLRVQLRTADLAEMATGVRGVERSSELEVLVEGADGLETYRNFVTLLHVTRIVAQEI